jgi:hypothetical protein
MDKLKKAWAWINKHATAVMFTIVGILLAGILWKYRKNQLNDVKDELEVSKALSEIGALNARRGALNERVEEEKTHIEEIDRKLLENKRVVVEALEYSEPLNADQILIEFAKLGI